MNRRCFLKQAAAAAAMLTGVTACSPAGKQPNIVFIFIDDMGYADPGCFGNPVMKTPNMDRLAEQGVRFTNFYVNSPICSPSRVSVTTGQYPQRWRIQSYLDSRAKNKRRRMADYLDPEAPTLARLLKQQGYATAHFGKWHMGGGRDVDDAPLPAQYGFDESLVSFEGLGDRYVFFGGRLQEESVRLGQGDILRGPKHKATGIYVDKAIQFIREHQEQPFYVRVFPNDVHDGHHPEQGAAEKWKSVTENPYEQKFFAVLEEMDKQLGRLIDEIESLDLAKDTLIILTSDNGPTDWPKYYEAGWNPPGFTGPFYGRKWSLYEGGIRMPFIARWDGKIPADRRDDQTVMAGIDLLPTLCRLADVQIPAAVNPDGEDMSRALLGRPMARSKPLCWEYGAFGSIQPGNPDHVSPVLAVRDCRWKLLMNPDDSDRQLYDLIEDPGETVNRVAEQPGIAEKLSEQALEWWREMRSYYPVEN